MENITHTKKNDITYLLNYFTQQISEHGTNLQFSESTTKRLK